MRVLVTAPYHDVGREELSRLLGEVIYRPWKDNGRAYNEDELIDLLKESRATALITEHDHVTEKVITTFPTLQFIGVCRGTPSNVAVAAATALGIPVFNTPARNAQAVAEMFISNVVAFMRKTWASVQWLDSGQWNHGSHTSYLNFKGNEIAGKKFGMIGFGAVGQTIANLLRCFPAKIMYYDPYYTAEDPDYVKAELDTIFRESDVVAIHLPENEHTKGMIGESLLSIMKPSAIFVNTARASVVNREDLLRVIENEKILGAVLDVFDHEPPDELDYRLIHHPNVLATPHIAGATYEVEDHHVRIMNDCLQQFYLENRKDVKQLVNKQVLKINVSSS